MDVTYIASLVAIVITLRIIVRHDGGVQVIKTLLSRPLLDHRYSPELCGKVKTRRSKSRPPSAADGVVH
jgi:hypothetical protein